MSLVLPAPKLCRVLHLASVLRKRISVIPDHSVSSIKLRRAPTSLKSEASLSTAVLFAQQETKGCAGRFPMISHDFRVYYFLLCNAKRFPPISPTSGGEGDKKALLLAVAHSTAKLCSFRSCRLCHLKNAKAATAMATRRRWFPMINCRHAADLLSTVPVFLDQNQKH